MKDDQDALPTSSRERERERMTRSTADDLPFGGKRESGDDSGVRLWVIALGAIVLALAIPLYYTVIGLGGAAVSSGYAVYVVVAAVIVAALFAAAGLRAYVLAERSRGPRDDFGNRLGARLAVPVKDIMKTDPVVCGTLDSIYDCAQLMYQQNVGFCAVLDADDLCVGVITDRDLVCGGVAQDHDIHDTPITTIMEPTFRSVSPRDTRDDCLRIMENEGVRRLPVLDGTRLVGLVALDDLIVDGHCDIEDVAIIVRAQLAEPGAAHRERYTA